MTVAREGREGPLASRAMWLGHYADFIAGAFLAVCLANDVTGWAGWMQTPSTVASSGMLLSLIAESRVHGRRLCERCIAAAPLAPQRAVDRWRRALWSYHQGWATVTMVAVFCSAASIALFYGLAAHPHPPAWALAYHGCAMVAAAVFLVVLHLHSRLHPWCPFCRWDDGGDEEVSPDVPDPAVSR